jgi:hypothetical protein
VKRRLRPIPTQKRARFRVPLIALLMPLVGFAILGRGDAIRAPLGEREAALAIAAQPQRGHLSMIPPAERGGGWTAATLAITSTAPRLLSSEEFHLRLPGIVAGSAALGAAVVLGQRLFAGRIGLAAAVLLVALPAARSMLGRQLGADPFFLCAMLIALAAMRDMSRARVAAIYAGIATGVALALGGSDGLWLFPVALSWLRFNQGLNRRSFTAVVGTAVLAAGLSTLLGQLWLMRGSTGALAFPFRGIEPQLSDALVLTTLAWSLMPIAPLAILGVAVLPRGWSGNRSLRFVGLWLVFALASAALGGSLAPAYVAILFFMAMLAVWGLERSRRLVGAAALAATAGLAVFAFGLPSSALSDAAVERWAVRETGRFVWRMIPADRPVSASAGARHRLIYYGRRPVGSLESAATPSGAADYLIVPESMFRSLQTSALGHESGAGSGRHGAFKMIAQFGTWVVVRTHEAPQTSPAKAAASDPEPGAASPSVRPPFEKKS